MSKSKPRVLMFGSLYRTPYGKSWIEQSIPRIEQLEWQPLPFDNLKYALEELDESVSALATRVKEGPSDYSEDTSALLRRSDELDIPRAVIVLHGGLASGAEYIRGEPRDIVINGIFPEQVPIRLASWLVRLSEES